MAKSKPMFRKTQAHGYLKCIYCGRWFERHFGRQIGILNAFKDPSKPASDFRGMCISSKCAAEGDRRWKASQQAGGY